MTDTINVSYSGLESGATTTSNYSKQVTEVETSMEKARTILSDESVFMGPAQVNCLEEMDKIDSDIKAIATVTQDASTFLNNANDTYKTGDKKASNLILGPSIASAYTNPSGISGDHLDFINSIKDGAVKSYNDYGVLPSLTMAQAILESGWGGSSIGNNIFGIKAGDSWTGKTQDCLTSEQNDDGSYTQITATFRDYDSVSDSIEDHAKLLTNDRYRPVIEATNYRDACYAVKDCGYATSHEYANNLINIIEQYGLDQWDPKVT